MRGDLLFSMAMRDKHHDLAIGENANVWLEIKVSPQTGNGALQCTGQLFGIGDFECVGDGGHLALENGLTDRWSFDNFGTQLNRFSGIYFRV